MSNFTYHKIGGRIMTTPFNTNLKDQVAVVTVGGGVLGSYF